MPIDFDIDEWGAILAAVQDVRDSQFAAAQDHDYREYLSAIVLKIEIALATNVAREGR